MRQAMLISYILFFNALAYGGTSSNADCHNRVEPFIVPYLNANTLDSQGIGVLIKTASLWLGLPENNSSMPILKIPKGTKVKILTLEKGYYKINHKDLIGYIEKKLVKLIEEEFRNEAPKKEETVQVKITPTKKPSPTKPIQPSSYKGYSVIKATSLRMGPHHTTAVILRLPAGARVEVIESSKGNWWKVEYKGESGWAKCALLKKGG